MPCLPFSVPVNNITDYLPANCLLVIFEHLPFSEVSSLDKVCSSFRSLKRAALERRRELTLVVGAEWRAFAAEFSPTFNHDGTHWFGPKIDTRGSKMRYPALTKEVADYLGQLLPKVNRLQVMLTDVSSDTVHTLIPLIAQWAFTLNTLKVGARFRELAKGSREGGGGEDEDDVIAFNVGILLRFINELPELEHLALQVHHRIVAPGKSPKEKGKDSGKPVDLSALSRLQTAFLLTNDRASVFYEALKHHAERNTTLVSVGLQSCVDAEQFYRSKMARLSAPFAAKFLALDLGRAKLSQQDMDALGAHFTGLTNLGLALSTPISLLPILLRSCKSLTRLHLYIHTATYMQLNSATNRGTSRSQIASVASRTSSSSPGAQLPQIVALTVTFAYESSYASSHMDVSSLRLEQTFPGLQSLEYSAAATCCTICGLRVNASLEQRKRCHDISLATLQSTMPNCKVRYYLDF